MSSSVTVRPVRGVRGIGLFAVIVGIVMILAGGTTWGMVTSQLRDENITVSDGAQFFVGDRVQGPLTAYAQAEVINKHALAMTDGQTYAQLPQDDPRRDTVMNASFLRASLFTSVVAFGVALLVVACGLLFLLIGIALRRLGRGDVSVLDVVPAGAAAAGPAAPVAPAAPVPPVEPPGRVAPQPAPSTAPPVERTSSRHVAAPPEATAPTAPTVPSEPSAPVAPPVAAQEPPRAAPPTADSPSSDDVPPSAAPRTTLPTTPDDGDSPEQPRA